MVGCECVIYQRVNYVLDRSQFLKSSVTNDLRDGQILMVRKDPFLPSTPHHRWLDQLSSPLSLSNGNGDDQGKDALRSAPSEATRKRRQGGIRVSAVLEPEASG